MLGRLCALVACVAIVCAACGGSVPSGEPKGELAHPVSVGQADLQAERGLSVDEDYFFALNTADQFLNAWLQRDWEKGSQYLTQSLNQRLGSEQVHGFFSGLSNPHHQAFEVTGYDRPAPDRIRFAVWLYEHYTDTKVSAQQRPEPQILTLAKVSDGQWLVDELPHNLN